MYEISKRIIIYFDVSLYRENKWNNKTALKIKGQIKEHISKTGVVQYFPHPIDYTPCLQQCTLRILL